MKPWYLVEWTCVSAVRDGMEALNTVYGPMQYRWFLHISNAKNSIGSNFLLYVVCLLIWRSMKISWKIDTALHPRLGFPFNSRFYPDVTYGLRADVRGQRKS